MCVNEEWATDLSILLVFLFFFEHLKLNTKKKKNFNLKKTETFAHI